MGRFRGGLVLPCLLAGVLVTLSVPPLGLWPLGIAGLALLYVRIATAGARLRALGGFAAGVGLYGPSLFWATGFNVAGWVGLVVVSAAFLAAACVATPPRRGRALAFPAALTLVEAVRSTWPFGGFPLGGVPLGQAGGPLASSARLGGDLLVTGLAGIAAVGLGEAYQVWSSGRLPRPRRATAQAREVPSQPPRARSPRPGHALAGAAAALVVIGAASLSSALPDGGASVGPMRVAAVQGGGQRGLRESQVEAATVYEAQVTATGRLNGQLALVLWPEDVVKPVGALQGSPEEAQLSGLARSLSATLVAGVTSDVGTDRFRNQAVAWGPSGQVVAVYDKVHRVPFGEYVPARFIFRRLANLQDVPRDAIAGSGPGILRTPAGPLAVMVSYEVFFADRARSGVEAGGQLMIVPTNTSSYSTGQVPAQEIAASRLRAIEEGRDLLQAAPTGYSAVLDNRGRVLQRSSLGSSDVIEATVQRRNGRTVYSQTGDVPIVVLAAVLVLLGWSFDQSSRRRPREPELSQTYR